MIDKLQKYINLLKVNKNNAYQWSTWLYSMSNPQRVAARKAVYEALSFAIEQAELLLKSAHESNHEGCCPFCKHDVRRSLPTPLGSEEAKLNCNGQQTL